MVEMKKMFLSLHPFFIISTPIFHWKSIYNNTVLFGQSNDDSMAIYAVDIFAVNYDNVFLAAANYNFQIVKF